MPLFRKKPVVVEARQFETDNDAGAENMNALVGWVNSEGGRASHDGTTVLIKTLEGFMEASCRDWIIKGVNGEFYPCKPDIFAKSYEAVT